MVCPSYIKYFLTNELTINPLLVILKYMDHVLKKKKKQSKQTNEQKFL